MTHLLPIRGGDLPARLVLIREGVNTLTDAALTMACQRAHELAGIHGFSVLELPAGGYEALARLRPLLRVRRQIRTADGHALAAAGFALLPTWELSTLVGDRSRSDAQAVCTGPCAVVGPDPEPGLPARTELAWMP